MLNYKSKEYRDKLKMMRKEIRESFDMADKWARAWSSGKILEPGCGEYPLFEDSVKVDVAKISGCIQADCNYPLPIKEKFDTIVALGLLEHLWNVDNFMKECRRLLKQRGILILSMPSVKWWKIRLRLLLGNSNDFDITKVEACRYFSPESLKNLLKMYGFAAEDMKPIGRVKLLDFCGVFIAKFRKIK